MSVRENPRFGLVCQHLPEPEIKTRIDRAADILQIGHLLERKPSQLSGGQSQRVAIGRAIVKEPVVSLFDEPLSNLDAELRVKMRSEIVNLHRRLHSTVVYVTHDQVEAMTMAEKIVVLRDGITEQVGTPIELYARPRNRFVAGFLGAPQMNMFAGRMISAGSDGVKVTIDAGRGMISATVSASASIVGQECTLGVRSEHLVLADRGDIRVIVDATEMLGADTIVYSRTESGERVVASIRGIYPIADGSRLGYAVDQRFVHVFDEKGLALSPLRSWSDDYIGNRSSSAPASETRRFQSAS